MDWMIVCQSFGFLLLLLLNLQSNQPDRSFFLCYWMGMTHQSLLFSLNKIFLDFLGKFSSVHIDGIESRFTSNPIIGHKSKLGGCVLFNLFFFAFHCQMYIFTIITANIQELSKSLKNQEEYF